MTEIYLMNPTDDRDYFVDGNMVNPIGLCEQYGITLAERPNIPTAEMRYDASTIIGKLGDHSTEDNYENVEIELYFNYINVAGVNARETYHAVSNVLARMPEGTRLRFSDDNDGTFRELARQPIIEPLNNDLYGWGDFVVVLILKPFRYIEEKELRLSDNTELRLEQPLPNAKKTPQTLIHQAMRSINIETYKNKNKIYEINTNNTNSKYIRTDAEQMNTYGGD